MQSLSEQQVQRLPEKEKHMEAARVTAAVQQVKGRVGETGGLGRSQRTMQGCRGIEIFSVRNLY